MDFLQVFFSFNHRMTGKILFFTFCFFYFRSFYFFPSFFIVGSCKFPVKNLYKLPVDDTM